MLKYKHDKFSLKEVHVIDSEDLRNHESDLPVEPLFEGILSIAIINPIKGKSMHG